MCLSWLGSAGVLSPQWHSGGGERRHGGTAAPVLGGTTKGIAMFAKIKRQNTPERGCAG